jgi:hypothetical protein
VKDAMKHNKLLEVAHNKTKRQCDAIRTFLKANNQSAAETKTIEEEKIEKRGGI